MEDRIFTILEIYGHNRAEEFHKKKTKLSWGSVQAETVRLQRQIDPGLMNIHLKFWVQKIGGSKKILGPK